MSIESSLPDRAECHLDTVDSASEPASHVTPPFNSPASRNARDDSWMMRGFVDPVTGSQAAFRCALNALAHPGRLHTMPDTARCEAPNGLSPAMAALLLTLADADTPVWLAPAFGEAVRRFLRFHNGCALTDLPEKASFAVLSANDRASVDAWPSLSAFAQGEPANPHDSTTLLIDVPFLTQSIRTAAPDDAGAHETATLRGPGIADTQTLSVAGLPDDFWRQWRANHTRFPLGIDAFLINGASFCGLPRTTQQES